MNIEIAARLKLFCHKVGTICLIPHTTFLVQVFPTLLRFTDLMTGKTWEEKLAWKGPVKGFTLELDLEKGRVEVFAHTATNFKRHTIQERLAGQQKLERLSLGKHTKLDWELVLRRMDMEEMAPVLFQLGQLVPQIEGQSPLLKLLEFKDKTTVVQQLSSFFKVGFYGMMAPRLTDDDFQGIIEEGKVEGSPLALLRRGYEALRSLFFTQRDGFSLLPNLPPQFHAGRLLNLATSEGDLLSMEWSKKQLKKVMIYPRQTREVSIECQKSIHSFRVNKKLKQDTHKPLLLEEGKTLFLDRFEK